MAPLPAPEPARLLHTSASLDARKLRFEVNHMELPMGVEGTFGVIKHPGASLAVPVLDDGRVVVLRQYRFAVATRLLEFPAGTLDPGETPLSTMQRELQEEAGYSAERWDSLGAMLPCPGYSDEVIHLFLARDLTALAERPPGDDDAHGGPTAVRWTGRPGGCGCRARTGSAPGCARSRRRRGR